MGSLVSANVVIVLFSCLVLLSGLFLLMGLCCKGKLSRWVGGFLGVIGVAGYLISLVPTCY